MLSNQSKHFVVRDLVCNDLKYIILNCIFACNFSSKMMLTCKLSIHVPVNLRKLSCPGEIDFIGSCIITSH